MPNLFDKMTQSTSGIPWEKLIDAANQIEQEEAMPWIKDEATFEKRFGITYDEFCEILCDLPPPDSRRYEKIRTTDIEAAIVWALERSLSLESDE
jgi:hypothetical protein